MGAFIKVLAERPGLCLLAGDGAVKGEYKKITGVVIRREMRIDCR